MLAIGESGWEAGVVSCGDGEVAAAKRTPQAASLLACRRVELCTAVDSEINHVMRIGHEIAFALAVFRSD